jgi:hypothetical protein
VLKITNTNLCIYDGKRLYGGEDNPSDLYANEGCYEIVNIPERLCLGEGVRETVIAGNRYWRVKCKDALSGKEAIQKWIVPAAYLKKVRKHTKSGELITIVETKRKKSGLQRSGARVLGEILFESGETKEPSGVIVQVPKMNDIFVKVSELNVI